MSPQPPDSHASCTLLLRRACVLVDVCTMMWAINLIYDCPGALSISLRDHLHLSDQAYHWLLSAMYAVTAIPNIFLPLCAGFAVKKYGRSSVWLLASFCVLIGQGLFAVAVSAKIQWLLLLGRFVFGLGSEVLGVVAYDMLTVYFGDFYLNIAVAILLTTGRFGSTASFLATQSLIERRGIAGAVWSVSAVTMTLISGSCLYGYNYIPHDKPTYQGNLSLTSALGAMPRPFWVLIRICIFGYACVNTFTNTLVVFLATWFFNDDLVISAKAASIVTILSSILVPLFGAVMDSPWVESSHILMASCILMLLAHVLFLLAKSSPTIPLLCLGTAFAAYGASFWTVLLKCFIQDMESTVVTSEESSLLQGDENATYGSPTHTDGQVPGKPVNPSPALGVGLATSVLNLVTAVTPLFLAAIHNVSGFLGVELAYGVFAALSCCASLGLLKRYISV